MDTDERDWLGVCESYRICQHQCMGAGCVCYAGQFAAAAAVVIVVNLTQVRVIWEEWTSTENYLHPDRPIYKTGRTFS